MILPEDSDGVGYYHVDEQFVFVVPVEMCPIPEVSVTLRPKEDVLMLCACTL